MADTLSPTVRAVYREELAAGLALIEGVQISVPLNQYDIRQTDAALATIRDVLGIALRDEARGAKHGP